MREQEPGLFGVSLGQANGQADCGEELPMRCHRRKRLDRRCSRLGRPRASVSRRVLRKSWVAAANPMIRHPATALSRLGIDSACERIRARSAATVPIPNDDVLWTGGRVPPTTGGRRPVDRVPGRHAYRAPLIRLRRVGMHGCPCLGNFDVALHSCGSMAGNRAEIFVGALLGEGHFEVCRTSGRDFGARLPGAAVRIAAS